VKRLGRGVRAVRFREAKAFGSSRETPFPSAARSFLHRGAGKVDYRDMLVDFCPRYCFVKALSAFLPASAQGLPKCDHVGGQVRLFALPRSSAATMMGRIHD